MTGRNKPGEPTLGNADEDDAVDEVDEESARRTRVGPSRLNNAYTG